jgi:hypothetical protein
MTDRRRLGLIVSGNSPSRDIDAFRAQTLTTYTESGLFSDILPSLIPELSIHVQIESSADVNWPSAILSSVTFFLIPTRIGDTINMTTAIIGADGNPHRIAKHGRVEEWLQLFLVFHRDESIETRTLGLIRQLNRETINEARTAGLL